MTAILFALVLLTTFEDGGYFWEKKFIGLDASEWRYRVVSLDVIRAKCKEPLAVACAEMQTLGPIITACTIYLSVPRSEAPRWMLWHEEQHCKGWVH